MISLILAVCVGVILGVFVMAMCAAGGCQDCALGILSAQKRSGLPKGGTQHAHPRRRR